VVEWLSDAAAIERSLTDPRTFEVIFDRHFDAVYRFAIGRVGNQDAADIAAETFARAFSRRHRFRLDRSSALPWLFGITVNVCRERSRRSDRSRRAVGRMNNPSDAITEPFENALTARVDAERLLPDLVAALRSLSDDEYALLMLAGESDLSYQEMADTLGIPIGTVRSRLARARRRVKSALTTQGSAHVVTD
jgi:RNA polymerase sigma factor (sigma-70 family)